MNKLIVAVVLFSIGLGVHAQALKNTQQALTFILVESEPYAFFDEANLPSGIAVHIANVLSKESGIPFELEIAPAIRMFREFESGREALSIMNVTPNINEHATNIGIITDASMLLLACSC